MGPQHTLYVPAAALVQGANEVCGGGRERGAALAALVQGANEVGGERGVLL